jgi:hypothetical protein
VVETASPALGLSGVGPSERPAAKRRTQRDLGQSRKPSQDARDLNRPFCRGTASHLIECIGPSAGSRGGFRLRLAPADDAPFDQLAVCSLRKPSGVRRHRNGSRYVPT